MMSRFELRRRKFIQQGAAVAAVAATAMTTGSVISAEAQTTVATRPPRSTKTQLGSIVSLHGSVAQVAVDGGSITSLLRLHGFPQGYLPVIGERVAVSDRLQMEGQFQVLPLVRFEEVVPAADRTVRSGRTVLRSAPSESSPELVSGTLTKVWISDNKSGSARIMASRPASA